jgi:hypothetical protein
VLLSRKPFAGGKRFWGFSFGRSKRFFCCLVPYEFCLLHVETKNYKIIFRAKMKAVDKQV